MYKSLKNNKNLLTNFNYVQIFESEYRQNNLIEYWQTIGYVNLMTYVSDDGYLHNPRSAVYMSCAAHRHCHPSLGQRQGGLVKLLLC
jgi:hypothetical protein